MIDVHNFRDLALYLGFSTDPQEASDVLRRTYGENGEAIRIDFSAQRIDYPVAHGFKVNQTIAAAPAQKQAVLQMYL